jgi:hypothetical protein
MAEIVCTNRKASSAFRGQEIIVTLNHADSVSQLSQLTIGDPCVIDSSTATGTVASIDLYGHSFKVKPDRPEQRLGTGTTIAEAKATFDVDDSVTVTI